MLDGGGHPPSPLVVHLTAVNSRGFTSGNLVTGEKPAGSILAKLAWLELWGRGGGALILEYSPEGWGVPSSFRKPLAWF